MRSRNGGDIDFVAERTEDHLFAIKQGDRGYSSEDKHREQPDLTLGKLDCIPNLPDSQFYTVPGWHLY